MKHLLDTDTAIDWLTGRSSAEALLRTLTAGGTDKLGISLATYGELLAGVRYSRDPEGTQQAIRRFMRLVGILPLTRPIIRRFADLKAELSHQGQVIGDFDTLIAATALHHGLILVTRNRRHFGRIPELALHEDR